MYFNYSLTEDFTLMQTFAILEKQKFPTRTVFTVTHPSIKSVQQAWIGPAKKSNDQQNSLTGAPHLGLAKSKDQLPNSKLHFIIVNLAHCLIQC